MQFGLQVVTWPDSVVVQVVRESIFAGMNTGDEVVGSMYVMIPGAYGVSRMGAVTELYRFQGEANMIPKWVEEQKSATNLGTGGHASDTVVGTRDHFPSGAFQLMAKWGSKSDGSHQGSLMGEDDEDDDGDGMPDIPPRPSQIDQGEEDGENWRVGGH